VSFQGGANNALAMLSADGRRWSQITTPTGGGANNNRPTSITGGPGEIVVAVLGGTGFTAFPKIFYSANNGFDWQQIGPDNGNQLNCVAYSKKLNRWVAMGMEFSNRVWFSNNGVDWTRYSLDTRAWTGVCWGFNEFVAVSSDGSSTGIATSPTGLSGSWTFRNSPPGVWRAVCYGDGVYCAVGDSIIATSGNGGVSWTQQTIPVNNAFKAVAYGNGMFIVVSNTGTNNRALYSKDRGVTWNVITTTNDSWNSIAYGNGRFVATALNQRVMISGDIIDPPNIQIINKNI
jgi:hypothetical protein